MEKLECIVKAMDDKLASHIVAIDMRGASPLFDTFVLCTASNARLMQAISQNVEDALAENDFTINAKEGLRDSKWILIDCGDIVCHIFESEERDAYNLEKLWGDMPRIDVDQYLKK
ncbi:MAG TPA: ribosome silencing factor [Erysipelotrichaceae bacterium]|nr:ribosome silencing factor [Erysipelotrichaceae bacterium]